MRVPVRLPLQYVQAGAGLRRAVRPSTRARRRGLGDYGGDVRLREPLGLVFHGNLGQDIEPVSQTYEISAEPPLATTADILTSPSGPYVMPEPVLTTTADILTSPTGPYVAAPDTSSSWWQDLVKFLPAITGVGATIAKAASGGVVGATTYVIPATASTPAQRVTYNPATGQVTTVPITAASGLPAFFQTAPGAAWYQNPVVLLGGGLVVLLVLMAGKRR